MTNIIYKPESGKIKKKRKLWRVPESAYTKFDSQQLDIGHSIEGYLDPYNNKTDINYIHNRIGGYHNPLEHGSLPDIFLERTPGGELISINQMMEKLFRNGQYFSGQSIATFQRYNICVIPKYPEIDLVRLTIPVATEKGELPVLNKIDIIDEWFAKTKRSSPNEYTLYILFKQLINTAGTNAILVPLTGIDTRIPRFTKNHAYGNIFTLHFSSPNVEQPRPLPRASYRHTNALRFADSLEEALKVVIRQFEKRNQDPR